MVTALLSLNVMLPRFMFAPRVTAFPPVLMKTVLTALPPGTTPVVAPPTVADQLLFEPEENAMVSVAPVT